MTILENIATFGNSNAQFPTNDRLFDTCDTFNTYLISHSTCHIFESSVDCVLYGASSDIQPMFLF